VGDGKKGWKEPEEEAGEEQGWDTIHIGASAAEVYEEMLK